MTAFVVGRKAPHAAGVLCAIALAELLQKRGVEAAPVSDAPVDAPGMGVLQRFGLKMPQLVASVAGQTIALAGPRSAFAGLPGLDTAEVIAIVEPASLDALSAAQPQTSWRWAKGCTATLLKSMFDFYGMELSRGLAGGLLAAILLETDALGSLATEDDTRAAHALAAIAGIADYQTFAGELQST